MEPEVSNEEEEYEPLPFFPTAGLSDEVFNGFERITYDAAKEEDDKLEVCSICLESRKSGQTIVLLSCSHKYHESCANDLFKTATTCSLCRKNYK